MGESKDWARHGSAFVGEPRARARYVIATAGGIPSAFHLRVLLGGKLRARLGFRAEWEMTDWP